VEAKDLVDRPPIAGVIRHRITEIERQAVLEMAQEEWADLRHRKLAHMLGRLKKVFVSESTVLRVLRAESWWRYRYPGAGQGARNQRWRPTHPIRSGVGTSPRVAMGMAFWHLVAILGHYSRKGSCIIGSDAIRYTAPPLPRYYALPKS